MDTRNGWLITQRPSSPVAMKRQGNSGQVEGLVMQRSDPTYIPTDIYQRIAKTVMALHRFIYREQSKSYY